jgi:hypothetical protein
MCVGSRYVVNDKEVRVEVAEGSQDRRVRGLWLMSPQRGQSWCPDKGNVYGPTWPCREPSSTVL